MRPQGWGLAGDVAGWTGTAVEGRLIMSDRTLRNNLRKAGFASAAFAAVAALSACGGGSAEAYCSTIEDSVDELASFDDSDPQAIMGDGMDGIVTMLEDSAGEAPEEISDEHSSVQEIFEEISNLDMGALLDPEALLEMSEDEMAELETEAAALEERFAELEDDGQAWGSWIEENCEVQDPIG